MFMPDFMPTMLTVEGLLKVNVHIPIEILLSGKQKWLAGKSTFHMFNRKYIFIQGQFSSQLCFLVYQIAQQTLRTFNFNL